VQSHTNEGIALTVLAHQFKGRVTHPIDPASIAQVLGQAFDNPQGKQRVVYVSGNTLTGRKKDDRSIRIRQQVPTELLGFEDGILDFGLIAKRPRPE